jgi:hypothetical protein
MEPRPQDHSSARTVVLRVRLDGELPIGRAIADDRRERCFTGWLGLMGVVQALIVEDEGARVGAVGQVDRGSAEPHEGEGN